MSTVSGPTAMTTTATTISTAQATLESKVSNMAPASVLTETVAYINGNSLAAPAREAAETRSYTETTGSDFKDEARSGGGTSYSSSALNPPLPSDLKRILTEVARTGSCSWLTWNHSGEAVGSPAAVPTDNATVTAFATGGAVGRSPPFALARQNHRRSPFSNRLAIAPPRKKHRIGIKVRGQSSHSRKRPLFLIRTSAAGGSIGSGRTSGSEPDDSTQYECDSEGTSATSCSELSAERNHLRNLRRLAISNAAVPPQKLPAVDLTTTSPSLRSLKDAFRLALGLVLDHWYRHRGGYILSPAERRRSEGGTATISASASVAAPLVNGVGNNDPTKHHPTATTTNNNTATSENANPKNQPKPAPTAADIIKEAAKAEAMFQQRRQRLLTMLGKEGNPANGSAAAARYRGGDEGPPFTVQRIAEVLIAPERYYTQTHKLCNCLEKLLLVTSSTSAFGGSTGGITSQSRLEDRELAALESEKGRLETEFRQRALKRRNSSMSDDLLDGGADAAARVHGSPSREDGHLHAQRHSPSPDKKTDGDPESSSREMMEAAARSLRSKFDHTGMDPHSSAVANLDVRSIAENRGMTNSPPPPSLAMSAAAASNMALPGHCGVGNFVRQHHGEQNSDHPNLARVPSPILFSQGNDPSTLHAPPNMHLLHMHHVAPLAGTPFDVVTIGATGPTNLPGSNEGGDLEGRSSASNSDVDSESDDVSFDDSASDRSDGSDSGHYEPFTAARAMALNRIQQQQRLHHHRSGVLTSLALHQNEGGFRPPADSEYQSGDSIDSTRGEDSGGSDSSSSDLAD